MAATNNKDEKSTWHLDRKVSLTHIFTTVSAIVTLGVFWANMNTRLTLVEQTLAQAIVAQHGIDERQDAIITETRKQIREDLKEISGKLDRIIEKGK